MLTVLIIAGAIAVAGSMLLLMFALARISDRTMPAPTDPVPLDGDVDGSLILAAQLRAVADSNERNDQ